MIFQKGDLLVRKIRDEDDDLLAKWLSDPRVLTYYEGRDNPFDIEKVRKTFFNRNDNVVRCIFEYKNIPIGYIQFYQLDYSTKRLYGYVNRNEIIFGTDQFIGEVLFWNRGIGSSLVSEMVNYLVSEKHADRIVMDPQTWNKRAITCYEKCGFKKAKLLPKQEFHEGEYRDCQVVEWTNFG